MHGGGNKRKHKHSESSSGAKYICAKYCGGGGEAADKESIAKQD
jgi:hypothetical protein